MIKGLLKKPDGICVICRQGGFTKGGLQRRGWNPSYRHRLAKIHLYRFETKHRPSMVIRICANCVHDLELSVAGKVRVFEDRGGVGGELGSPTWGKRTKYDHDLAVRKMEAGG